MTIFKGHLVVAACSLLGIEGPDSKIVDGKIQVRDISAKCLTIVPESILGKPVPESSDGVHSYARVLCHHSALVMEFHDAWCEGDGPRVLKCWNSFLLGEKDKVLP